MDILSINGSLFLSGTAAKEDIPEGGKLVVWAFYAPQLKPIPLGHDQDGSEYRIEFVTAPPSDNEHLRAQKGLFTLVRTRVVDPFEVKASFGAEPFDKTVECWVNPDRFSHSILLRFTLDTKEARKLLWLLAKQGVTAASVYPNFKGVVTSLQERSHWVTSGNCR